MLTIYDGRGELWQWDIERKLVVTDETATEVHFSKSDSETALVCEVYSEGEARVVNIPNIMLQDYANLIAYTYDTTHTMRCTVFAINRRAKPADYVYTETEVKSYEALDARVRVLEEGGTGKDGESAYEIAVRLGFEGSESEWQESLKGEDGEDGVSASHSWNGTVLTVTSASGTSSADLKGAKGDKGDRGATGATGPSAQIDNISEGVDKEGARYQLLTFSDGTPILIYDGKAGKDGKSAYAYAVDGGYEGTEEEFSENLANGFAPSDAPVTSVNGKTGDVKVTYLAYGDSGGATESRVEMALATGRTPYFRIIGGKGGEYEGQEFSMYYQTTDDALYGRYKRADGNIFFDKVYTDRNPQPLTAESIVDSLGYVPEEKNGVYELINTITLEGGESAVDITVDSAANVFALKAAFVKVETPASTDAGTGYIETYYGNQRISKHHISNIKQSSSTKVSKAEVMQRYGRWAEYTYGGAADGATANLINIVQFTNEATTMDCKYVDKVRVRVNNLTFDAGTKITVWGVRTNSSSEPIRITKQPVDITIAANNTVTFSVEAEGNGLTYQWEYLTLTGSAWKNNTLDGNTTATLTFKAQDYHNGYKYRCLITDAAGNTVRTNEVVLTIGATSA